MTALETTSAHLAPLHPLVDLQTDVVSLREAVAADVTQQFWEIEKIMDANDIQSLTVNGRTYAFVQYTRKWKIRRRGAPYQHLRGLTLVDDSASNGYQLYTIIEHDRDPRHYTMVGIYGFDHNQARGLTWGPSAVDKIGVDIKALTEVLMETLAQTEERYRQTAADIADSGALLNQ